MVFLFELGGEKELSIPLIMGVILFAVTSQNSILIATAAYTIFATLLGDYQKRLKREIDKDKLEYDKFFNILEQLMRSRLYVEDNDEIRLLRGIIIYSVLLIASVIYLTYNSVDYLVSNFTRNNISLILLITTAYSLYSLINYILMMPISLGFETIIQLITRRYGDKNEDLENATLESNQ